MPDEGTFWNTLGVSHYRAGNWKTAIETLKKSDKYFGEDGLGFNATFIAMAYWKLGDREEADRQYRLAVQWMRDNELVDDELFRFCREAAQLLGRPAMDHDDS